MKSTDEKKISTFRIKEDYMTQINKVRKFDYTDIMIWGGILIMLLWIIAKLTGLV